MSASLIVAFRSAKAAFFRSARHDIRTPHCVFGKAWSLLEFGRPQN